ncbi:BQ2448_6707 [Microbotryum intermedium]|uniref:BQ2448_6707 protein n=1 Tax=Microbotryum intermedium TaxID=269621 RepID=A0A238FM92_9BASI|nr:BQ2448_6707 [Microbotryum intermedium]
MSASQSSLPHAQAPYIVFSDFDGTITTEDSNDAATDNVRTLKYPLLRVQCLDLTTGLDVAENLPQLGFGLEKRRALNLEILNGTKNFRQSSVARGLHCRDAFREMIDSVAANNTFDETREYLRNKIKLDAGFKPFFEWCKAHDVPVVIVSSGMVPIIRAIMENLVGVEDASKIDIIANDVEYLPDGKWTIKFRHPESGFGHDKSRSTSPYRDLEHKPTLFFCGDGVSDLSAARAANLLFVKVIPGHTNDLSVHCDREQIPYVAFEQFLQVKDAVANVIEKRATIEQLLKQ